MVSTVRARPNHYDVLGLPTTASDAEIAAAFTRAMSPFRPRAFGGLAEVGIAYETLRDAARRRAYDASIGLVPEPPAEAPAEARAARPEWTPFLIRAAAKAPARPGAGPSVPHPTPGPATRLVTVPAGDARLDRFAALAAPTPWPVQPDPEPVAHLPSGAVEHETVVPRAERAFPGDEVAAVDWRRGAAIGGGLVAAVALASAWAGSRVTSQAVPDETKASVTLALPQPGRASPASAPQRPAYANVPGSKTKSAVRLAVAPATRQVGRAAPPPPPRAPSEDRLAEIGQALQGQPGTPAESAAGAAPPVEGAVAAMPLPDAVVARTLRRIGYPCGTVASTTPAEGGPAGVFTINCSSGHSYRATPVHGRYRFRRTG